MTGLFRLEGDGGVGDVVPGAGARPATMAELEGFFDHLVGELDAAGFLRNREQRPVTVRNLRNMFLRASLFEQEVRTLRGVVSSLVSARDQG